MFGTFIKELKLLFRDLGGLLLLLIMPAMLIVIMALVQDAPFKDFQNIKFKVLILNQDKGNVAAQLITALGDQNQFDLVTTMDQSLIDSSKFYAAIKEGTYTLGIHFPQNTSTTVYDATNRIIKQLMGLETGPQNVDTNDIRLVFDPSTKPTVKNGLTFALQQELTQTKTKILLDRLSKSGGNSQFNIDFNEFNVLNVKEYSSQPEDNSPQLISSVQHNVPAWAVFGIFMIVVPISGSIIREREDGSALRIKLIPNAFLKVSIGKILFYITLCFFQFLCMLGVGLWILPLFGLDPVSINTQWPYLIPMIICIAFAAVSYGYMIGNIFKTSNQANSFGSISIVLLSALGGIWVPIIILPEIMQKIAQISPLYWSLEGINAVLLRNGGWSGILKPCSALIIFGVICTLITTKFKKQVD